MRQGLALGGATTRGERQDPSLLIRREGRMVAGRRNVTLRAALGKDRARKAGRRIVAPTRREGREGRKRRRPAEGGQEARRTRGEAPLYRDRKSVV